MNTNGSNYADLLNTSTITSDQSIIYELILPNLDENSVPYIDVNNVVQDRILNDGQILVGVTSGPPVAANITGTTNEIIVSNGPGSITISTPQPIGPTSDPTFSNLTVTTINGKIGNDLVTGPASAVSDRLASYNGTTGKIIKDSLINTADVFLRTGTVAATGNFNINNNELQNVKAIRPFDTNINYGNSTTLSGGGTGQVMLGDFATSTGSSNVSIGVSNIARNLGVAIGKETICGVGGVCVGYRSQTNQTDVIHIGRDNTSNAVGADVIGVNRNNTTPNSLLLGNNAYVNIRANNTCDLGTTAISFQSLYSNTSIIGTVNSRLTNDIVSNTGISVNGDLCSFSGTSGKVITSSSIVPANIVTNSGTSVSGNLSSFSSATGKIITDSGKAAANVVTDSGTATTGRVATYTGTKVINDSGTLLTDLATNASVTAGLALKVSKSGDTMSGALAMGTNNITNIGTLSGATNSRTADNILSCTVNPTYGNLPMWSTLNKVFDDSGVSSFNVVTGPASATVNNIPVFSSTTGKAITTSTSTIGTLGAITLNNTTDSTTTGNGSLITPGGIGVAKQATIGGFLRVTQSNSATTSSDGSISTLGGLSTAKNIIVGDTDDAISSTTGSLKTAGGIGVAKRAYIGTNTFIGPTQTTILDHMLTLRGTVTNIAGPHVAAYVSTDQYPIFQQLNWGHDNISHNFDAYYDNTAWRSSSTTSQYQIYKTNNQLQFNSYNGAALGSTVPWTNAGYINTSGNLIWNKKVTISTPVSTQGLDLATADAYANLRVIQNTTSTFDKHLYIGYQSGATSHVYLYSNNLGNPTVKVEGPNVGIGMSPFVGGGNNNNIQMANGAGPTGFAGTPGGALYVNAGRLFYIGSAGTATLLAPA